MRKLAILVSALSLVLAATPASAGDKDISPKRAKHFLQRELNAIAPDLAKAITEEAPGLTLVNTQVNDCKKRKTRRPRTDCDLAFTFRDQQGQDVTCQFRVKVTYRSNRSSKLKSGPTAAKIRCNPA